MYLREVVKKYAKVVFAQVVSYGIVLVLASQVFLGPIPVVRADIVMRVKNSPVALLEALSNVRQMKLPRFVKKSEQATRSHDGYTPSPWVFKDGPLPTVIPGGSRDRKSVV